MLSYTELILNASASVPFLKTSEVNKPEDESGFIIEGYVNEFSALLIPGYP